MKIVFLSKSLTVILLAIITALVSLALVSMPIAYSQMLSPKAAEKSLQPSGKLLVNKVEITSPTGCYGGDASTENVIMSVLIHNNPIEVNTSMPGPAQTAPGVFWYIGGKYVGEGNPISTTVSYEEKNIHSYAVYVYKPTERVVPPQPSQTVQYGRC